MNKPYLPALLLVLMALLKLPSAAAQLTVTLTGNPPLCGGFATGSILATVNGGQPPYQFEWSNGETGNPITGLSAGWYALTVTDQDGTEVIDSIELSAPPPLEVPINVTACTPPGAMTALPSGGTPPYSLSWNTGDTTATISGLPLGQYCITVLDANNCAFINCQYIGEPMSAATSTTNAACNNPVGGGSAEVSVSGGVPPFDYEWDNGMSGPIIDSIPAGPVSVTITGYNGCSIEATDTVGLEENPLGIQVQTEQPGCSGDSTGWAIANAPGAYLPADYSWNTGDSSASIYNLPAGTYTVTVQDAMGCTGTKTFQLNNSSNLKVTLQTQQPSCHGTNNGMIKIQPDDGIPPFTFNWNTGDSTQSLENLAPGLYTVTVADNAGCSKVDSVTLTYPPPFQASFFVNNASHCAAKDGSITPAITGGGTWPFNFKWSDGSTDSILQNAGAGLYYVSITSSEGCQLMDSVTIEQPNTLIVNVSGTSLVCGNENTGMLTASVQYGSAPYQYLWSNGETTPTLHNLGPGSYSVTVTSSEGCEGQGGKTIFNSPVVSFTSMVDSISCNGAADGSIAIDIQSGLAPFSIQWSTGANSTELEGLSGGTYDLTITDIAGCSASEAFTLTEPDELVASIISDAGTCDSDAHMQAIATGGTGPYTYQWSNGSIDQTITSSSGGDFSVTITDGHGCSASESVFLQEIPGIQLDLFGAGTSCFGKNDGTVVAIASAGTPPFQFQWSNGATTNGIGNLPPGVYAVTVTDLLGCTQTGTYTVAQGPALSIDIVAPQYSCVGSPVNATVIPPTNAVHPLSFEWSTGQQSQLVTGLEAGGYSVTLTDAMGCQGIDSVQIQPGGVFSVATEQSDISCFGASDGEISVELSGGNSALQITWNTGDTGTQLAQLGSGVYEATITESASGCTKVISSEITEPSPLAMTMTAQPGLCGDPAFAQVNVSGGVQPWSLVWSNGDTSSVIETYAAGQYSVLVTDANGCTLNDSILLEVASKPELEIEMLNYPSSPQAPDGILTAVYSNLEPPVQINWSNTLTGDTIYGLSPGLYSVTLTDANDCEEVRQFEIPSFARIGDLVWFDQNNNGLQDSGEPGLDSVKIEVQGVNFTGGSESKSSMSDSLGLYGFFLPPGEYVVNVQVPQGYEFTNPLAGGDTNLDSDIDPSTGTTPSLVLGGGETRMDIDAGLVALDTCDNVTEAGEICCNDKICLPADSPVLLSEVQAAGGGSGDIFYQWYQTHNDQAFDPGTWDAIPGADGKDFHATPIETTFYVRTARRGGCVELLPANVLKIETQTVSPTTASGPQTVCAGLPYSYEVALPENGAEYEWIFSPGASLPSAAGVQVPFVSWGEDQNAWLAITKTVGVCSRTDTFFLESLSDCEDEAILLIGMADGNDARLFWQWPADSLAGVQYQMEWATPQTSFSAVATLDSTFTSGDSTFFQHIHLSPPSGKNYYRLKLTESGGNVRYSNVVQLIFGAGNNLVHAYPNPFDQTINLAVVEDFGSQISFAIVDARGRIWLSGHFEENEKLKTIPTEDLVSGLYFIMVKYDGALTKVIKVVRR